MRAQRDVGAALDSLAAALESVDLGPHSLVLARDRDRIAATIRSYLIPRSIDPGGPITVVLAGPTGSGKSTLLNSLAGFEVSSTGALRPTTSYPIVLASSDVADRYRTIGGIDCEVVIGRASALESLVLVDAPDLDSTSTDHRVSSEALIDNADIVVFVMSALRYADEVPWQVLRRAVSRGAPVINVLNRVAAASSGAIVDFRSRLTAAGLGDELITVSEHHLSDDTQRVPELAVGGLRNRLEAVVTKHDEFAGDVFQRVLRSTLSRISDLAREVTMGAEQIESLQAELSLQLVERAAHLDLSEVGRGLCPPPPAALSRREVRRWKRELRRVPSSYVEKAKAELVARLASLIHSDMRGWLAEEESTLPEWSIEPRSIIPDVLDKARSQLAGWLSFVSRIAADHDDSHIWLHEAVLLEEATLPEPTGVAGLALGEDGESLVNRARRELTARLELIYEETATLLVETAGARVRQSDVESLTLSLGAVVGLAHFDA